MNSNSGNRGVRNNNPANIDYNPAVKWQGQVGLEAGVPKPRFIQFSAPEYGIRALAVLLLTYHDKHRLQTVRGIINRYAPSKENNTSAYVANVARALLVTPNDTIDLHNYEIMRRMVIAIIAHENGNYAYPDSLITKGLRMAGVFPANPPELKPLTQSATMQAATASVLSGVGVAGAAVTSVDPYTAIGLSLIHI
jgi:hypothetical protein